MTSSADILLAGDGPFLEHQVWTTYRSQYQIHHIPDPSELIPLAEAQQPKLIVLGHGSDHERNFQVCEQLTNHPGTERIPVVIVCDQLGLKNKMAAYRVGAFDCVEAAPDYLDLDAILRLVERFRASEQALSAQARSATDTAMSAMAGNNELGQAIRFVERSVTAASYTQLADTLLGVTQQLQLECALLIQSCDGPLFFSQGGEVSPLEQKLLLRIHGESPRLQDFGPRTFVRFPGIVLMVKEMPLGDETRYGRIKDLLPSMLGAADARIKALDTETILTRQTQNVSDSFERVRITLQELEKATTASQENTIQIMRDMLHELDFKIPTMGLEEDQEEYLVSRIDQAVEKASEVINQSAMLGDAFHFISRLLQHLSATQAEILAMVQSEKQTSDTDSLEEDDVVLF